MLWIVFTIAAALCWGLYGPILARGQAGLRDPMKALLCVGAAYFLLGILVPLGALGSGSLTGYNRPGLINSTVGGALGALGAVCVIWAFKNGGAALYVMPLVFGGAPIINVLYSMWAQPPKGAINPLLWVGMIIVPVGAALVLYYKPS